MECYNHCFTAFRAEPGSGPLPDMVHSGPCLPAELNSGCLCLLWEPEPSKPRPGYSCMFLFQFWSIKISILFMDTPLMFQIILPDIALCLEWKGCFLEQALTLPLSPKMVWWFSTIKSSCQAKYLPTLWYKSTIQNLNQGLSLGHHWHFRPDHSFLGSGKWLSYTF